MVHTIAYVSDYTGSLSTISDDLPAICKTAQNINPTLGITGVLFYHNGKFMQVIEGERGILETLMDKLGLDSRHTNIMQTMEQLLLSFSSRLNGLIYCP